MVFLQRIVYCSHIALFYRLGDWGPLNRYWRQPNHWTDKASSKQDQQISFFMGVVPNFFDANLPLLILEFLIRPLFGFVV